MNMGLIYKIVGSLHKNCEVHEQSTVALFGVNQFLPCLQKQVCSLVVSTRMGTIYEMLDPSPQNVLCA